MRRLERLGLAALLVVQLRAQGQGGALTAREVVAKIQSSLAVTTPPETVDTFKAGNPDTRVTGIAVTMMATYDVLEKAAASGHNLVITHEPTFYNHLDQTAGLEGQKDAIFLQKQKFIAEHHLVVWRFHDGWHLHKPDGILLGMTKALGWQQYQTSGRDHLFQLPPTTVRELARQVKASLNIRVVRVVGDPEMKVSRVGFLPGAAGSTRQIQLLEQDDVEVLLIGETPEWETVEYVADAQSEHRRKALIILGHIPSEQSGMKECASWLQGVFPGVPVQFIPAAEPFWSPSL